MNHTPTWTLTDTENRDETGAPHQITGPPDRLIPYLDGTVRNDLRTAQAATRLDQLITAYHNHDIDCARHLGLSLAIHTEEARNEDT